MDYKIGQSVVVKDGVIAIDYKDLDLGGWQGRIIDIDKADADNGETIIGVAWDSITLRSIPNDYLEECEREGFGWSEYYLESGDVKPTQPRDSENEVEEMIEEIERRMDWLYLGDEGKRIRAVIDTAESEDEWAQIKAWSNYLQKKLKFPFDAVVIEYQERGPLQINDELKVVGVEMEDEHYGVIVQCKKGRKRYDFPLCDLDTANEHSSNFQPLNDYRVWFANN